MLKVSIVIVTALVYARSHVVQQQSVLMPPEKIAAVDAAHTNVCTKDYPGNVTAIIEQIKCLSYDDSDATKEFIYCVLKAIGLSSESGVMNTQNSLDFFPEDVLRTHKEGIINLKEKCKKESEAEATPAARIFATFSCFEKRSPIRVVIADTKSCESRI